MYDEAGTLEGTISYTASEFDDDQLDLMLASVAYEATIGSHGHSNELAFDPDTYSKVEPHRAIDYVTKRIEEYKVEIRKKYPNDPMYGSVWYASIED